MIITATFSCGHAEDRELIGSKPWIENQLDFWRKCCICKACQRRQQEERVKAAMEKYNAEPLEGTPRQIAKANRFREAFLTGNDSGYLYIRSPLFLLDRLEAARIAVMTEEEGDNRTPLSPMKTIVFRSREELIESAKRYVVKTKRKASWWIKARADEDATKEVVTEWARELAQ